MSKVIDVTKAEKVVIPNEICIDGTHIILRHEGHLEKFRDELDPPQPEHMRCSNCGQYWAISEHADVFKYCFNCGADMREKLNETKI